MKQSELSQILKEHEEWLKDNKKGKRADLRYAYFYNTRIFPISLQKMKLTSSKKIW